MIDYNGMTSDEIKADIERTRSQMSHKIDTLQDRLSPDNLKQQAQTMVQDVVKESTDALIEYVNTNAQQMTNTILEAIRNNPVPAAVVGLGLGWLIMNSVKNGPDPRVSNQYMGPDRMNRQFPSQSDYATYTGDMGATGYASGPNSSQYGSGANELRNPGYQDWSQGQSGGTGSEDNGGGIGQKAGEIAGQVRDSAQQMAGKVMHGAANLTEPAANLGGQIKHQVGDLASQAQDQAQRLGGQAQQMTGQVGQQAQQMGGQAQRQAQHMGGQMQRTVQRSLEDNPLGFGVVAIAAGIALGLALPATRHERELMGDMSTRVVEKTQTAASNVVEDVKQAAAEAAPKLQETAKRVAEDISQTGREATNDVKDTLKQSASSVGIPSTGESAPDSASMGGSTRGRQGDQSRSGQSSGRQASGSTGYEPSSSTSSTGTTGSSSMSGGSMGGTSYTEKGYQGSILQSGSYAGSVTGEAEDDVTITGDKETAPDADTDSSATTNLKG